jgi:FG-GAP repeat/FG-GAP-like repeat
MKILSILISREKKAGFNSKIKESNMKNTARKLESSGILTDFVKIVFIGLLAAAFVFGQENEVSEHHFPTLTGEKAIDFLKQSGDYEAFAGAVQSSPNLKNSFDENSNFRSFSPRSQLSTGDGYYNQRQGASVSISGNIAVVGAPGTSGNGTDFTGRGAVYVFVRNGTTWTQEAKLMASDGQAEDAFGTSVSISGTTIIVGAPFDVAGTGSSRGSAYIFERIGATWGEQAKLVNSNANLGNVFGWSVAVEGNTAIVGDPAANVGSNSSQGMAFVYERSGTVWALSSSLTVSGGAEADYFGYYVALSGNTAAIAATRRDVAGNQNQGAVYIYNKNGTAWTLQQSVTGQGGTTFEFGRNLSLRGDYLAVTAYSANVTNNVIHVFVRNGSGWSQQTQFIEGNSSGNSSSSVAVSGNILLVGVYSTNGLTGFVSVYMRSGGNWIKKQTIYAADQAPNNLFGMGVAISGNTLIIGEPWRVIGGNSFQGASYIYQLSPSAFNFDGDGADDVSVYRSGTWFFNNSTNGFSAFNFGLSTDRIAPGDFNGDGIADVSVYRSGVWYRIRSGDNVFVANSFGLPTDIPVSGDFNGNGTSDVAVYRPSNGTWYWLLTFETASGIQFGLPTDKPAPADFDGDGITDVAVFRPSNGFWYWLNSSNGQFRAVAFGQNGDIPVVGDYDGDGRADQAVYRPSNGTWYQNRSTSGFWGAQFGVSTDTPVAADYDGDGKSDIGVFRNGTWYLLNSTRGFEVRQFGLSGDKPIPAAFLN